MLLMLLEAIAGSTDDRAAIADAPPTLNAVHADARMRYLELAWAAALLTGVVVWLAAPEIVVTETSGNGCGQWNATELARHREQLALFLLLPLIVAESLAAVWVLVQRENLMRFSAIASAGLVWTLLLLWQPVNAVFVWSQILSFFVVPVVLVASAVWFALAGPKGRRRAESMPAVALSLLALLPLFALITLVLWTRTPWEWSC